MQTAFLRHRLASGRRAASLAAHAAPLAAWVPARGADPAHATGHPGRQVASPFLLTLENEAPPSADTPPGMVWIPAGEFSMGSGAAGERICHLRA